MLPAFTIDTRAQEALCLRPLFAERLDAFRTDFWDRPWMTLGDLFADSLGVLDSLLKEAALLEVPHALTPWEEYSAAHLLDYLTQDHREFFGRALVEIDHLFGVEEMLDPEIQNLHGLFGGLVAVLKTETEAEETRFFRRVLRYEACLRNPGVHPEFDAGSLRVAVAYRNSLSPDHHEGELRNLIGKIRETELAREDSSWSNPLADRLEGFLTDFLEHERLESEVLYPMADELERKLYNLSIAGSRRRGSFASA